MYARAVDDARARLRELRTEEWLDLVTAVIAFGLAIVATLIAPSLALPLFIGGVAVGMLGVRTLWRRWDLVDRLAGDREAYAIPEVLAYASQAATMDRRRSFAALIRTNIEPPSLRSRAQLDATAAELETLADELEDDALDLDPACAVACQRLVSDPAESPLLNPALPRAILESNASRIRSGFTARRHTA